MEGGRFILDTNFPVRRKINPKNKEKPGHLLSFIIIISFFLMVFTPSLLDFNRDGKELVAGENIDKVSTFKGSKANDTFGWNVSNAGDVNGDGIEDIIIGAPGYGNHRGRAYIFFGGPWLDSGNLEAENANVTLIGSLQGDKFGWDVSSAGNVNDDNYDDVIVGAPGNNSGTGSAYIFFGNDSMSFIINASDANVTLVGGFVKDEFGFSVSGTGDVDSDGIDDVIVGAPGNNSNTGAAYLFFGYPGIDSTMVNVANANVTIYGEYFGDHFGWSISDLGNVNSELTGDLIIGAPEDVDVSHAWGNADLRVNLNTTLNQHWPSVAVDPWGNVIAVWHDNRNNPSKNEIYAQKFDPNGNSLWASDMIVNQSSVVTEHLDPDIAVDSNGNVIVVWMDERHGSVNTSIYAQKLDSNGIPQWGPSDIRVNQNTTYANRENPAIAVYPDGNVTIVWDDQRHGVDNKTIYAQKIDTDGNPLWSALDVRVNQFIDIKNQYDPDIVVDSSGNASVVWHDARVVGSRKIYAQKLDYDGNPLWNSTNDVKVSQNLSGQPQGFPAIALCADGNLTVVWEDYRNGDYDIFAQKINSTDGTYLWDPNDVKVNQYTSSDQRNPSVVVDLDSDIVVVWHDKRKGDYDIYIQKLNSTGYPQWGPSDLKVNQLQDSFYHMHPKIAIDSNSNVTVVWYENRRGDLDIYAQKLVSDLLDTGKAYIFYGRPLWSSPYDASSADVNITGESKGDQFGFSVSGAENIDNKDWEDFIIGAPGFDSDKGRAYLFNDTSILLASNARSILSGEYPGDMFGYSVSGAGNFSNDSYPELIVGAPNSSGRGSIYIFNGSNAMASSISASNANYSALGENPGDRFGHSVSYVGNISLLEGNDVVLIGAPLHDSDGKTDAGKAYLYYLPPIDNTKPEFSDVIATPPMQETGYDVNITCNVTDNREVYVVWVNITYPDSRWVIFNMLQGAGDLWYYNGSYIDLGSYSYTVWANDTNDNRNNTTPRTFEIQDTIAPMFGNVNDEPDPQENGGSINISVDVKDNYIVNTIWINITYPNGSFSNESMLPSGGFGYYYNITYSNLGLYSYTIWANDTSNNLNSSDPATFTIQDLIGAPEFVKITDSPDPQEYSGFVNITVELIDDISVDTVWINITCPNGSTWGNESMNKGLGDQWYFNKTWDLALGNYTYIIWANDTSNNWNSSTVHNFTIEDKTDPEILDVKAGPNPQVAGEYINITCNVTDNVEVDYVEIGIQYPISGTIINYSMIKGPNDEWFFNDNFTTAGLYNYFIIANDTSNNLNSTFPLLTFTIEPGPSYDIQLISGSSQNGIVGTQLLNPFIVEVRDEFGNIVPNAIVWFNITSGDGSLDTSNPVLTDSNGRAQTNLTMGITAGNNYVTAEISGEGNSQVTFTAIGVPDAPFDIILISGDGQSGVVATELAEPFIVEVQDQYGNTVSNAPVWFNVSANNGNLDVSSLILSGSDGRAQANLTLGTTSGLNRVRVEISGGIDQVSFNATGIPDEPYDIVYVSGTDQSAPVDTQVSNPFVVEVRDVYGNLVPNTNVWFNITQGGGSLSSLSPVLTDSNGRAQSYLTLGTVSGLNRVTAEISGKGIVQVIFDAIGIPGEPFDIIPISGNEQSGAVNTQLSDPFIVEVYDVYGNLIPNTYVWLNITQGGGLLSPTSPVLTDSNGRAQSTLTLGPAVGINIVTTEISGEGISQVTFTATGSSNKPEITRVISNIDLQEDDDPYTLDLSASAVDYEDLPEELIWSLTDVNTSLYVATIQGYNILIINPQPDMFGNDLVTLWVSDTDGQKDSQPLWINITPVNDKPYFFPIPPDLTVTKDVPYSFNYAPYVRDKDNDIRDLTITTDDPDHTTVSSRIVTYLYPSNMVNTREPVILTLGDGIESDSVVIWVNISEDNVPILTLELPDVTIHEGDTLFNVFDLDEYFYDPDGDSIYFSYGYSHLKITIKPDHFVDFYASSDWYGVETVTFRARDPSYAIVEDTIQVTVLPVNDPPDIDGVPELVVHYDADYFFDLTPYITDADDSHSELSLSFMEFMDGGWKISTYIDVTPDNNLRMVVNYSIAFLNMKFPVKIEVSDGIDSDVCIINITVSEDWPPVLLMDIPDVVYYEDEYIINYFNVTYYFWDPDNEPLFYTYGQVHVIIVINDNGTVDFSADEDWFGIENITIRATDPEGALVEDIITVTVLPVNDAPTISQIPDQTGEEEEVWVLDISSYLHDVDNSLDELTFIIDSDYVIVVGMVLIFQYPKDVESDSVTVTVSDGKLNGSTTFSVSVTEPMVPSPGPSLYDYLFWLIFIPLLIGIFAYGMIAYKRWKDRPMVEEAFLIYEDGLLITHVSIRVGEELDEYVLSSMLTAVRDFVDDAFIRGERARDEKGLHKLEFGERNILFEKGDHFFIATVFKGKENKVMLTVIRDAIGKIEDRYKEVLEKWYGNIKDFEGAEEILSTLLSLETLSEEEREKLKEARKQEKILEEWSVRQEAIKMEASQIKMEDLGPSEDSEEHED